MTAPRHLPFLERLQRTPGGSQEWESLAQSYRLLGLIDAWAEGTPSEEIRGILAGASTFDPHSADGTRIAPELEELQASLIGVDDFPDGRTAIARALRDWSARLWNDLEPALALDTIYTALEFASEDRTLSWQCHRDCAVIHRVSGDLERADDHYAACAEVGRSIGDDEPVFWGNLGFAKIARARGNLPNAQLLYDRLVKRAIKLRRSDLEAIARHELAITLCLRGRRVEALGHLRVAFSMCRETEERHRILADIAFSCVELAKYDSARGAYLQLLADQPEISVVLCAHVGLIQVAAALGDRASVEAHRRFLEVRTLPTLFEIDFQMTLGRAYQSLGDTDAATPCLLRAAALAERCGTGRELIETEAAIVELSRTERPAAASPTPRSSAPGVSPRLTEHTHLATGRRE